MSLRWQILGAFFAIILLTISLATAVSYWTNRVSLLLLTQQIAQDEAAFLSQILSQAYTETGGWDATESVLFQFGFIYSDVIFAEDSAIEGEFFIQPAFDPGSRVVVTDIRDSVIIDTADKLAVNTIATDIPGESAELVNTQTGEPIGQVTVDVNDILFKDDPNAIGRETLQTTVIGGFLTAIIALLLAFWLSKRITAPVQALTQATQEIAEGKTDITIPVTSSDEIGIMSHAFNEMAQGLATQKDLRKRLISDVSHELNTPLSVIQLEAKGLSDGLQSPESAAKQIMQEVSMLRNLVTDLNWLAETDLGEIQLRREAVHIEALLSDTAERWQSLARAQEVSLTTAFAESIPVIAIDSIRIKQVISNLIRNSLQHTSAGGRIDIQAVVEASTKSQDGLLVITIQDDGVGIDPADLPHLFERFYRADRSRDRRTGGQGLGLAIAQSIVEAHAGAISIQSPGLGRGATVRIELPLSDNKKGS